MTTQKKPQKTPSQQIDKLSGVYNGAELRPFDGRPGAMDAFSKPSLVGDKLVKHSHSIGMGSRKINPVGFSL